MAGGRRRHFQEREALKYAGYLAAIDIGVLAFKTAFVRWTQGNPPLPLPDLVHATLDEMHAASTTLR